MRGWLALLLLCASCGAAASTVATTTPPRVTPTGEPRSFLTSSELLLAFDHRAIRPLPFASDFSALYQASGLFRRFVGSVGIDVVRDLDLVVAGGNEVTWSMRGGLIADRWRVVLRHRLGDEEARRRLESGAIASGEALHWRESQGIRSALLPGESTRTVPHAFVLSAPSELVVTPEDELPDVVATVRDHEARRSRADELIEPSLLLEDGVLARASGTALPVYLTSRGATRADATARWTGSRVEVHFAVQFASDAQAASAVTAFESELVGVRGNAFLAGLGVSGWVDRLTITAHGAELSADTSGDATETRAVCRALALLFAS